MKTFLHIDDHHIVRSGVKYILTEGYPGSVVWEAGDEKIATDLLKRQKFDLVIMDIHIPESDMLGLVELMKVRYPETKVLMFSMASENMYALRFIKAGASGYLPKDSSTAELTKAIQQVLNDRKYISPSLAEYLTESSYSINTINPFQSLSQREFEITFMILAGTSLGKIGQVLNLQVSTIGTHKARIFEKLGVKNLLELNEMAASYKM
jgi:two-component system invasion response regulator UvrY